MSETGLSTAERGGDPDRVVDGVLEALHREFGADARMIDMDNQSARLHEDVAHSTFHRVRDAGHMVHQTSPTAVMSAIDEAAAAGVQPQPVEGLPRAA